MRIEWIAAVAMLLPAVGSTQEITQRAVEAAAEGTADRTATPVAKAMLAIREGKWEPMSR
jgi:hypothetical protein